METKTRKYAVYDTTTYDQWADKIVRAVADYWQANGYGPSVQDICRMTGMKTPSRMARYIARLQQDGRLIRAFDVPRSLRLP